MLVLLLWRILRRWYAVFLDIRFLWLYFSGRSYLFHRLFEHLDKFSLVSLKQFSKCWWYLLISFVDIFLLISFVMRSRLGHHLLTKNWTCRLESYFEFLQHGWQQKFSTFLEILVARQVLLSNLSRCKLRFLIALVVQNWYHWFRQISSKMGCAEFLSGATGFFWGNSGLCCQHLRFNTAVKALSYTNNCGVGFF